jgi:hypothetical protein
VRTKLGNNDVLMTVDRIKTGGVEMKVDRKIAAEWLSSAFRRRAIWVGLFAVVILAPQGPAFAQSSGYLTDR